MVTGDGAYIKKINRGVILKNIISRDMVSRAELSKITGLNKATISVQVASLLDDALIYETKQEHHVVGRRPIMLSINREAGYVLGIDLDYKHIQYTVSDLHGYPVYSESTILETDDYDEIVHILMQQIKAYQKKYANSHYGLISVMIGIHGTVNKDELIYFVPKYQWHNKDLKAALIKEIGLPIHIENNANLSAFAENVYKYHQSNDLLTILLASGIGAGIMTDGELHKGYNGFAGEMGHMILSPDGAPCTCGNHGCWELYSAEPSLFATLAEKLDRPHLTYEDVQQLITKKDPITHSHLQQFIKDLSIGLNNIINLYNPETLVLNSEILSMYPNAVEEIKNNLVSTVSHYREIVLSELGNQSCVMGACALAIQRFLEVPELRLQIENDSVLSH